MDPLWTSLALRMGASAALVLAASLAVERAGPFLGAMIATLPLSTGPALVFLALDHDAAFLSESVLASLVTFGPACLFITIYVLVAPRFGTVASLAIPFAAFSVALAAIGLMTWDLLGAFALSFATNCIGIALTGAARRHVPQAAGKAKAWDLAVRAASVMTLVAAVILIGRALGPFAAGIAAMMPVIFTSLIALMQPRVGGAAMASVMAHALVGLLAFNVALAVVILAAARIGSFPALGLGLAICVAWNGLLVLAKRWRSGGLG